MYLFGGPGLCLKVRGHPVGIATLLLCVFLGLNSESQAWRPCWMHLYHLTSPFFQFLINSYN